MSAGYVKIVAKYSEESFENLVSAHLQIDGGPFEDALCEDNDGLEMTVAEYESKGYTVKVNKCLAPID